MRTLTDNADTLTWVLGDHLALTGCFASSASTTANSDGTLNSVIQYTAFGEIRLTQGITPTKYRYTGQLAQAELGLDFYVSRFYDPLTAHFTSADTIIPEPGRSQGYDRYSYSNNNPIKYTDPSGHIFWMPMLIAVGVGVIVGTAIYAHCIHQPLAPADGNASNVTELAYLGYEHAEYANIVGEAKQSLQNDPSVITAHDEIIDQIRENKEFTKEEYFLPDISRDFNAEGPSGNWAKATIEGNQAFMTVRHGTFEAQNIRVFRDGTITATMKITDNFNFIPGRNRSFWYNLYSVPTYFAYNIILGAEDDLPVETQWKEIIPPKPKPRPVPPLSYLK